MLNHQMSYWYPPSLLEDDCGGGEPVQLGDKPGSLVLAYLERIGQVLLTSHPEWHEIDELRYEDTISNHLSSFKTCCVADLPDCSNSLIQAF